MARARDYYRVSGNTVSELVTGLNFLLQRMADRMDRIEGIRGTASIESALDMNSNLIKEVGSGSLQDDAARLSDIDTVAAFTITAGDGLTGGGTVASSPTLNVGAGAGIAVAADAVGLATMSQGTVKGRAAAAGTGDPQDLTASQVKTILALAAADISDFNEAAEDAVLGASADSSTIDITYNDAGNSWSADVIADSISNSLLANMAQSTIKGRAAAAGTGDPTDLTASQVKTILAIATSDISDITSSTFTPTVAGATIAGTTTYGSRSGSYLKIASFVFFRLRVTWTGQTGTGNLLIGNLPFTSANTDATPVEVSADSLIFAGQLSAMIPNNSTNIELYADATGVAITNVAVDTAATVWISGCYLT
jgi:hypothetical protein